MAEFNVIPAKLKGLAGEFNACSNLMGNYANQVVYISASLNRMGAGTEAVKTALRTVSKKMADEQKSLKDLNEKLIEIVTLYENTEKSICEKGTIQRLNSSSASQQNNGVNDNAENEVKNMDDPDEGGFLNYIWDAIKQAVGGDFVDENNFLGIVLSVGVSFIPYVGQIADIRDLVADVYNLIDDGPVTEEWVALGFTALGIIPGLKEGLKYGDEVGDAMKSLLKNYDKADEAVDIMEKMFRKGDDAVSAVGDKIDAFNDAFKHGITDRFDELFGGSSVRTEIADTFQNIKNAVTNTDIYKDLDRFLDKIKYKDGDFEISLKKMAEGVFDEYAEIFGQWGITSLLDKITGKQQPEPAPAP